MSNDGWIDTQNVEYTHNGILFSIKKDILSHAITWRNLEDNMLSERNQWQKKQALYDFTLHKESKMRKFTAHYQALGEVREMGSGLMGTEF